MRVALRCIYYKAVTPSMDIVEMPSETWTAFLHGNNLQRIEIATRLLNKEYLRGSIREIAWIPIDDLDLEKLR